MAHTTIDICCYLHSKGSSPEALSPPRAVRSITEICATTQKPPFVWIPTRNQLQPHFIHTCFSFLYKSLCGSAWKSSHFAQVRSQQHTITLPLKINLSTAQRCCFVGGFMSVNNRITWELGLSDNAEGCISPKTLFLKFLSWTKPVKLWALMQLTPNKDEVTFQKSVLLHSGP